VGKSFIASALKGTGQCAQGSQVLYFNAPKITGTNQKMAESLEAIFKLFGRIAKWTY